MDFSTVIQHIEQIRDERRIYANTATRVGNTLMELLALAKEADGQYLSKIADDTAKGFITLLAGLAVTGGVKADTVTADTANFTTVSSDTTYEGVQTFLRRTIAYALQSSDFDEPTQRGYSISTLADGSYKMLIGNLEVWGKAVFNELEIRKLSYVGGNIVLSPAGSKIVYVAERTDTDGNVTAYRCYLLADDGTTATQNSWTTDDQARCQSFNIGGGNRYYWRLVTAVSSDTEQILSPEGTPLYDGMRFHWIDLSATDCASDSDTPQAGDTIAQMGNRNTDGTNAARTNLIQIVTSGDTLAPFIAAYKGVTGYYLTDNEQVLLLSPTKVRISSNIFEWVSAGGKTIGVKNYRGDWSDTETPYMYYDEVTYQGTLWLCTTGDADGTTEPPSENSTAWKAETAIQRLAMQLEMDGQTTIDVGETINITCRIFRGDDEIDTTSGWTWKATRSSGNTQDDAAWANRAKAKNFTGKIALSLLTTTDTDIPLTSPLYGTTFTFTAQQTGSTVKAAASISV